MQNPPSHKTGRTAWVIAPQSPTTPIRYPRPAIPARLFQEAVYVEGLSVITQAAETGILGSDDREEGTGLLPE
ncbi:hypothetical protein [Streptomyces sp. NPDC001404]|uniref:hypothetical protein n=1 Tax=Streptomyces sp. NPDC001404 TaxID=3364571 RepID=UPI00367D5710